MAVPAGKLTVTNAPRLKYATTSVTAGVLVRYDVASEIELHLR